MILDAQARFAYVSLLGVTGDHDYVVQYDTHSLAEVGRVAVGKEPHLSLARQQPWLYVACQVDGVVLVFDMQSLTLQTSLNVPRAHGVGMTSNGRYLYVSSVPSYDPVPPNGALYTIDPRNNALMGKPVTSPYPFPHNVALSKNGQVLFLTHSGATANQVSIYEIRPLDAQPVYVTSVTAGINPFGLAYIP